jgi:hypothetical protein
VTSSHMCEIFHTWVRLRICGKSSHIWTWSMYGKSSHLSLPNPCGSTWARACLSWGVLLCGECTVPENKNTKQVIQVRSPPYGGIPTMGVCRPMLGCDPIMMGCTAPYGNPSALVSSFHSGRGNTRVCQNPG